MKLCCTNTQKTFTSLNYTLRLVNDFLSTAGVNNEIKPSWAAAYAWFSPVCLINPQLLAVIPQEFRSLFHLAERSTSQTSATHTSSVTGTHRESRAAAQHTTKGPKGLRLSQDQQVPSQNQWAPNQVPSEKLNGYLMGIWWLENMEESHYVLITD